MMPGKSGYEFCRGLKDNPATRLIPFVLITGLSATGLIEHALAGQRARIDRAEQRQSGVQQKLAEDVLHHAPAFARARAVAVLPVFAAAESAWTQGTTIIVQATPAKSELIQTRVLDPDASPARMPRPMRALPGYHESEVSASENGNEYRIVYVKDTAGE